MILRKPFLYAFATTLGLMAATGVLAWTGPTVGAPGGNASAPLNVSSTGQTKAGGLRVNSGGAATGLEVISGTTLLGGNVGIGTTNPGAKLEIREGTLQLFGAFDGMNRIVFYPSGVGEKWELYPNLTGLGIFNRTDSTYRLWIANDGNVSLGATAPISSNDKLSVYGGNIQVQNPSSSYNVNAPGMVMGTYSSYGYLQAPSGGSVYIWNSATYGIVSFNNNLTSTFYGAITAPAFYYSSDARLKKNIEAIKSNKALQDILALRPVTYNWKDATQPTDTQLGFIAQEVEKIAPELVTTNTETGMKAVDYARVAPLLVGALQAQQERLDAQQKQIDALMAEVEALKTGK